MSLDLDETLLDNTIHYAPPSRELQRDLVEPAWRNSPTHHAEILLLSELVAALLDR